MAFLFLFFFFNWDIIRIQQRAILTTVCTLGSTTPNKIQNIPSSWKVPSRRPSHLPHPQQHSITRGQFSTVLDWIAQKWMWTLLAPHNARENELRHVPKVHSFKSLTGTHQVENLFIRSQVDRQLGSFQFGALYELCCHEHSFTSFFCEHVFSLFLGNI